MGVKVLLDSVDKVKDFVDITRSASYDIDLISGRNTYLDAKSLLGVLSCDCSKPLILDIHADEESPDGVSHGAALQGSWPFSRPQLR